MTTCLNPDVLAALPMDSAMLPQSWKKPIECVMGWRKIARNGHLESGCWRLSDQAAVSRGEA